MKRWLIPETVQTSAMDCGPASLKSLLGGFGIHASYGRLREACHTDVDGASIDALEETAVALGLDALQVMIPADHLFLKEADALPALVVVKLPGGATHFLIVWSVVGSFAQVMDPATGRRWSSVLQLTSDLYVHTQSVPAKAWREWAAGDSFLKPLRRRMKNLGASDDSLMADAVNDRGWRKLAALDAGVRMATSLRRSRAISRGKEACLLIQALCAQPQSIPEAYWSVLADDDETVRMRGALLLQVSGRKDTAVERPSLSPELAAALAERPASPLGELWRAVRSGGLVAPAAITLATVIAAGSVVVEALLFRGLIDLGGELTAGWQRLAAAVILLSFFAGLVLLEIPLAGSLLRLGRHLECRLRLRFLRKLSRLHDRYFQSRLVSDMAQRSHAVYQLRQSPELAGHFLRALFQIAFTAAAIGWFFPSSAPLALASALLAILIPLLAQPLLTERDLRLRNQLGAISRFYLDAMLGLTAVRAHGAQGPIRAEHGRLLEEWGRAGLNLQRTATGIQAVQLVCGFGLAASIVLLRLREVDASGGRAAGGMLLLIYWALNLPALGDEIAACVWQYPALRNILLRFLEPLGAPEENTGVPAPACAARGVQIAFEGVRVVAAGQVLLESIDLQISAGSHVAIVGASGAGKSTLAGILLGWHRPAAGCIRIDGEPLDYARLRRETAWAEPQTQLWNQPLFENLRYGAAADDPIPIADIVERADLRPVIERLPQGMQTCLGEGGALVSGGEGQRVRAGRALMKRTARLVILDEPARGLDRQSREALLAGARDQWRHSTMLCITHDIGDTAAFDRILVMDGGRIVEDGSPCDLAARPDGRYRALLDAEAGVREDVWGRKQWRRLRLRRGRIEECA